MNVNEQVTGRMSMAKAFTILVSDIEKESTTDEQASNIQAHMEEMIYNIKRLSLSHKGKIARAIFQVSPDEYAVFAAKNGDVVCFLYSPSKDDYNTEFGIETATFLAKQTNRIESRILHDFKSEEPVKYATFDKRIDEIDTMLLSTLANPPNPTDRYGL